LCEHVATVKRGNTDLGQLTVSKQTTIMFSASSGASAILIRPKQWSNTTWLDFERKQLVKASKGVGRTNEAEASLADSGGKSLS
jgi:hypothetical protein